MLKYRGAIRVVYTEGLEPYFSLLPLLPGCSLLCYFIYSSDLASLAESLRQLLILSPTIVYILYTP